MAIIDKTIAELLKSIGIKLKPGLATDVTRLPDVKSSFNMDLSKFGSKADPKQMKKLIETDANFVFKADEAEKEQFANNINYLRSEFPELFSKQETILSSKTGQKLTPEGKNPLGELSETEINLGVTTPEHKKLVKEYLDAKKEHLEYVEEAKRKFNDMYKSGDLPMEFESQWAMRDELKRKGVSEAQLDKIIDEIGAEKVYFDHAQNKFQIAPTNPEEYYKRIQDELKKRHDVDYDLSFYSNFGKKLKEPEFASGGRVGYDAGGSVIKAAMKALEKAKQLRTQSKEALKEGDWMTASTYDKQAQKIETGYFLNKDPKDVTFPDILDHHKATYPDTPSRYKGVEGEHWVDRARNSYKEMKERWAKEGEPVEQLKIEAKPSDRDYDFKKGGRVGYALGTPVTYRGSFNALGKTIEKGIGSMFKKKKR